MKGRLTYNYKDIFDTYDPIDVYDNDYSKLNFQKVLRKLSHYEDLEEQGRLIELPCAVGDTVYLVYETDEFENVYKEIDIGEVFAIGIDENLVIWISVRYESGLKYYHPLDTIGKTVFLTPEEAEAALKESEEE